jgi:hypothetical protein
MLLAFAAILFQFSATVPNLPGKDAKISSDAKTAWEPSAADTNSSSKGTDYRLKGLRLTSMNFADTRDGAVPAGKFQPGAERGAESLGAIHIQEGGPGEREIQAVKMCPRRSWLLLLLAEHGAAAFDAYSTRYAVGHGAVEENPLMRPFAHSASIYVVSQATPAALDFVARRMQRSENRFVRDMWWLPQSLSAGAYVLAGVNNLRVAGEQ